MTGVATALASLRLTLLGMLGLALAVLATYRDPELATSWVALPLGLLAVNLLAALLVNPRFRTQTGLLVFHLCLLAVVVLSAVGLMTHFEGRLELTEGQAFTPGAVEIVSRGPWHPARLDAVAFTQGPIAVDYGPSLVRLATRSAVAIPASRGAQRQVVLGDGRRLEVSGYRFSATSNKGYAAVLTWLDHTGGRVTGALHMPSYPLQDWKQVTHWTTPAGQILTVELEVPPVPTAHSWTLRVPESTRLRVSGAGVEAILGPGERVALAGGSLRYDALRLWMGYRVDYDPVLPWLFAAALVGILGMAHHFWRKLWRFPVSGTAPAHRPAREPQEVANA